MLDQTPAERSAARVDDPPILDHEGAVGLPSHTRAHTTPPRSYVRHRITTSSSSTMASQLSQDTLVDEAREDRGAGARLRA
jgi:hypothetical protein